MEMFKDAISITYVVALGFLGLWFLLSSYRKWNVVMGIGFFLALMGNFLFTMSFTLGPIKYFIFSKNLILISIFGFVFMLLRNNKIGLILAIAASMLLSFKIMKLNLEYDLLPPKVKENLELGELLIEARPEDIARIEQVLTEYGGMLTKAFYPKRKGTELDYFYIVDIPDDRAIEKEKLLAQLYDNNLIQYGEFNDHIQVQPIVAHPPTGIEKLVGINDPLARDQWAISFLQLQEWYRILIDHHKHAVTTTTIAVLDTGVDGDHEDLVHVIPSDMQSGDDPVGHGTHCAGIIAAETNNQLGVASLAFHSNLIQIMPIKVLNRLGFGTQVQIIKGMIKAVDEGAGVLSLSLGGLSDEPKQKAYRVAVEYAESANAVVVTSAGNSSTSARRFTPANVPGVICVTALNPEGRLASFSNYLDGIEWGIAAPGVDIISTYPDNQYKALSGTSMAAPFVSSTVGILKAFSPELTPREIYNLLQSTSASTPDGEKSGGLIQPHKALASLLSQI